MEEKITRKRITFYGYVQGVGFRYRAYYAASSVGVTGWVENQDDGSFIMEIQGTQSQIDQVVEMIEKGTFIQVMDMKVKTLPVDESEREFSVLY